jgi:hypothetical protein
MALQSRFCAKAGATAAGITGVTPAVKLNSQAVGQRCTLQQAPDVTANALKYF